MQDLERLLNGSDDLEQRIFDILGEYVQVDSSLQLDAAVDLSLLSIEYGRALRTLVASSQFTAAFCLMRPQFESLVRAAWAVGGAKESDIQRLQAPLTPMTEKEASKLPNLSEMLKQLRSNAPAPMADQLEGFKDASVPALNSFVHAGIHAVTRHGAGYPVLLVDRVVRQSNALLTMAGMLLAVVGFDDDARAEMERIQRPFEDCLPELLAG
jgi:hypothetical protein